MALYFESFWFDFATVLTSAITVLYVYLTWSWTYWTKRGVPQLEPKFPWGNFADYIFVRKFLGHFYEDIYRHAKGEKYIGTYMFSSRCLVLRDPELIKQVLVKDFNHFLDRGFYDDSDRSPLSAHLFLLSGQKWKNLRAKLTPTFTSGKMKMMFPTLVETGLVMQEQLENSAKNGDVIEVKDILARYSTDIIASVAFGIQCNCLKNPDAEFGEWGRRLFIPTLGGLLFARFGTMLPSLLKFARFLQIRFSDPETSKCFMKMVEDTVNYRENNNVSRNDFMNLLIQLKNKGFVESDSDKEQKNREMKSDGATNRLSMEDVAAQAFVFYVAGFETSSTTMTFCLYELCVNPNIQQRVQEEMDSILAKHGGEITYESMQEMVYLDKVVSETLRKYPPLPILNRVVTIPYQLPGTNTMLEKGTSVIIPLLGIQRDPKYFPEPDKFDPERFSEKEKEQRHSFTYLPFGEGPRVCIGMRFGLMQTKVGLISILSHYNLELSEKTPVPVKLIKRSFFSRPEGGMWLKITGRQK